jgi:uncharacterized protein (DUF362 family)
MTQQISIQVGLIRRPDYEGEGVVEALKTLLNTMGLSPGHGARVLVKPNLLAPTPPDYLPCTNPVVVKAVCEYLHDHGAKITVGDSPTFGKAVEFASKIGLADALSHLPVDLVNLDKPRFKKLSFGGVVPISSRVLDSDLVVSIPKLKAHHQTRITAAVKNVYGCVPGLRKPVLHLCYGDWGGKFETMLLEMWSKLPPSFSVIDGIVAMSGNGPVIGIPYSMGLLGASSSPVALDTAIMAMLGLEPHDCPLWRMALRLGLPGAGPEDITYPIEGPEAFDVKGFETPEYLYPLSFRPLRVVSHLYMKRVRRLNQSRDFA